MSVASRPQPANTNRPIKEMYHCSRCINTYTVQNNNFAKTQSTLYRGNNGYLELCNHCVDELLDHYTKELGGEKEAVKRLCLKLDIYWNEDAFNKMPPPAASSSVMRTYIGKVNSYQYRAKTYDDTIDEALSYQGISADMSEPEEIIEISPDRIKFWGDGFKPRQYLELDERYDFWKSDKVFETRDEEGLYRQIAMTDWQITKATQTGGKTDSLISKFNNLLSSSNIKLKTGQNIVVPEDTRPMGVKIRDYEIETPIPEPSEEFKDVDGIVRYVTVWFLGHLCKMLKIKNSYSRLYEEEMAKYRVERPEYEDEDDEDLFDSVFGGDGK